jgi:lipid-A-disaccharide synthase-like uncharacterized protein
MKFSMAKMMAVMGFVSLVLAAAFAMPPFIGYLVLTIISLLFLPQFIWVGAINTRGRPQAFFIGAILSGIPHFCVSAYFLFAVGAYMEVDVFDSSNNEEAYMVNIVHLIGYAIGLFGGLGGVLAHWFIVPKTARESLPERTQEMVEKPHVPSMAKEFSSPFEERDPLVPKLPK